MADASPQAFWLDRPDGDTPRVRPPIGTGEPVVADLVVVGAGFTGLWAAFEAARRGRQVVVVEAGTVAGGASGRCGGFVNSSITHGIPHGHARWPTEMAAILRIQRDVWDDTLALTRSAGVIQPTGKYTVATEPHHVSDVHASAALLDRYGEDVEELDGDGIQNVLGSPTYRAGYHLRSGNGLCDPVRLATWLADTAEAAGARIAERSSVTGLSRTRSGVRVSLDSGATLQARQVLLCTNAYPPLVRRLRAYVIPVYDHAIVTEPLDDATWTSIGWRSPAGITDAGNQFHYYRPTPDGRILFGGWDATYHFGGSVDARHEAIGPSHHLLARHLVQTFPALADARITHAWAGPIDSTTRFTPTIHSAWGGRLGWAAGFTGLGVGASRFAAQAALDQLAGEDTERTSLSMVRRQPIPFPPEPLRWVVVAMTKRALVREDRTGRRNLWLRTLDRVGVGFDT